MNESNAVVGILIIIFFPIIIPLIFINYGIFKIKDFVYYVRKK